MKVFLESEEIIKFTVSGKNFLNACTMISAMLSLHYLHHVGLLQEEVLQEIQNRPVFQSSFLTPSLDEIRHDSVKKMKALLEIDGVMERSLDHRRSMAVQRILLTLDPGTALRINLSYGLFISTLLSLGTERHQHLIVEALQRKVCLIFYPKFYIIVSGTPPV